MKERPIPYKTDMAKAVLARIKTNTRRICKHAQLYQLSHVFDLGNGKFGNESGSIQFECPYGIVGDRLWVREPWRSKASVDHYPPRDLDPKSDPVWYIADEDFDAHGSGRYRHARYMPRWASRTLLEITNIRVQRLQDISEQEAKLEGADCLITDNCTKVEKMLLDLPLCEDGNPYRNGFALLWESINGDGSWLKNPLVWVVEFKVIKP